MKILSEISLMIITCKFKDNTYICEKLQMNVLVNWSLKGKNPRFLQRNVISLNTEKLIYP